MSRTAGLEQLYRPDFAFSKAEVLLLYRRVHRRPIRATARLGDESRDDESEFYDDVRSSVACQLIVTPADEEQKIRIKDVENIMLSVPFENVSTL